MTSSMSVQWSLYFLLPQQLLIMLMLLLMLPMNCKSSAPTATATTTATIDKDSPPDILRVKNIHDKRWVDLVMSDEFLEDGRSFHDDADKKFQAIDKPDNSNEALQFYNSSRDYVTTENGYLQITTRAEKTHWMEWDEEKHEPIERVKNYTSGMVQTWNKMCFTGGVLEIAVEMPGAAGLWPAAWLMGNLARATFDTTTMYMWPWSYNKCTGEVSHLEDKQERSACEDTKVFGMHPKQGRGAPEIDIFEMMPASSQSETGASSPPYMISSLHVSPGIDTNRPHNGQQLNESSYNNWYENLYVGENGELNSGFWGQMCGPEKDFSVDQIHKYMEDALSVKTRLNESHFASTHVYRIEWQPPTSGGGGSGGGESASSSSINSNSNSSSGHRDAGYIYWYIDDKLIFGIDGESLESKTGAQIPAEPMYLILNTAMSHRWGMSEPCANDQCGACWHCYDCTNPECECALPDGLKNCENLPSHVKIDYVRLYQDRADSLHTTGCSPPNFPTAEFIAAHRERYADWQPLGEEQQDAYWRIMFFAQALTVLVAISILYLLCKRYWWIIVPVTENHFKSHARTYEMIPDYTSSSSYQQQQYFDAVAGGGTTKSKRASIIIM